MTARRTLLVVVGAASLLGFAAYSGSLGGGFVYDDVPSILENPDLRDPGRILRGESIRPLRVVAYATFALNRWLGGEKPFGYRLTNVAIHVGCALLVFALGMLLFRTPRVRGSSLAANAAAISGTAAVLFVAHPVQTQAVAYVVQRIASLATLLYLSATVLYVSARLTPWSSRRPLPWLARYLGALVATLLAMRTKEIAFTIPFALLLVEGLFFGAGDRRRFLLLVPFALTLPLIPVLLFRITPAEVGQPVLETVSRITQVQVSMPRWQYLATQAFVIVDYLRLLAWPTGLNADPEVTLASSLAEPRVIASVAFLAGLALSAVWALRRVRQSRSDPAWLVFVFGIGWFFIGQSVESSVIPIVDVMNEHRVYLSSVGAFLAVSALLAIAWRRLDPARVNQRMAVMAGLIGIALGSATYARAQVWKSELSLWSDTALKSPHKARPWTNWGAALTDAGRFEDAERVLLSAARDNPLHADAWFNLGNVYLRQGSIDEAERSYRQALVVTPGHVRARSNLAATLLSQRRYADVVELLRPEAERAGLGNEGHFNLGVALAEEGDFAGAWREVVVLTTNSPELGMRLRDFLSQRQAATRR